MGDMVPSIGGILHLLSPATGILSMLRNMVSGDELVNGESCASDHVAKLSFSRRFSFRYPSGVL